MIRGRAAPSCVLLVFLGLVAVPAEPQAIPTGAIAGRVVDAADGQPLPGATVTVTSPNLQGTRTGFTSANGDYYLPSLPPGEYTVRVELTGFEPFQEPLFYLGASQSVTVSAQLRLKRVEAAAVVTARSEQVSTTATAAATYTSDTMNTLPVPRTLVSAVALAPGVNQNGPFAAVTISGAVSYENVMTVNGANVQDNIRETPLNLFIEDAIQETTTITSGISAEFGRFTGGVVNTITKAGGNNFSGSFRATLNNDTWRKVTPYGEALTPGTVPTYEATLGGPFWKDHIWFFGAFRSQTSSVTGATAPPTSISFPRGGDEKRYEGKLTATPVQNQTITGSYMNIQTTQTGNHFMSLPIFDMASVYDRQLPQDMLVVNYNGVLSGFLFLEGQYSQRHFTFENSGSRYTDLINGTVLWSFDPYGSYNSPVFCAVCPGAAEKRDNQEYFGKLNWFLSTKSLGSHNLIIGFDSFTSSRTSNNWQSGSSYFMGGNSVIYKDGDLFPVIGAGSYLGYYPIFNVAEPSSVETQSIFFNDTWKLNDNFSFNLGVRYDKNNAKDSRSVTTADDSKFSPRLAAMWDPTGKGAFRVNATYAVYVAAPQETQVGAGSNFGAPAAFGYYYDGPAINTDPMKPLLTRAQALEAVFNWFGITAPNQFPRPSIQPFFASVPGVNTQIIPGGLVSPSATEWSVGVAGSARSRFTYRVEGVYRNYSDFYALYTNVANGTVKDSLGNTYDLGYVGNANDPLTRKYYGLHTNFQWRPIDSLNVGGSWTWSHTYGNIVGEYPGSGPTASAVFSYPEYHDNAWYSPVGNLPSDQRHRVRLFGTWDLPFPQTLGRLGLGFLYRMDTGLGYGAIGTVATRAYVTNPGYVTPPSSVTYSYTAGDAFRTATMNALDLSLNYGINIGPVEIFVQPQVINIFNGKAIVLNTSNFLGQSVNTAVNAGSANFARFDPFTTIPAQGPARTGANWNYGANFGAPLSYMAYQTPLTFRISVGIRF